MQTLKKILSLSLRIIISIFLLAFLFRYVDKKSVLGIIRNADKVWLFLAFIIFFFNYALCLLRWVMLLKAINIRPPLKRIITSFAGGTFFNLFLPSTIGGDFMRTLDLAAHTQKPKEVIATVLLDRLSGYVGLVLLALTSLMFGWRLIQDKSVLFSLIVITVILVVILLSLFNKFIYSRINRLLHSPNAGRLREMITGLHQEMHLFRHRKKIIAYNLIVSVLIQAVTPVTFFITALALGIEVKIVYFFIFLPIIGAITLLPISIGGLGLRDATTIFFFAKVGVAKDLAFAMSLLNFLFLLIYGAAGGLFYVFTVRHRRLQRH